MTTQSTETLVFHETPRAEKTQLQKATSGITLTPEQVEMITAALDELVRHITASSRAAIARSRESIASSRESIALLREINDTWETILKHNSDSSPRRDSGRVLIEETIQIDDTFVPKAISHERAGRDLNSDARSTD